jgi:peptidoglycan hydrolase-like protein with peptidoglycan-binding domain
MADPIVLAAKEKLIGLGIDPGTLNQKYDENMAAAVQNFQIIRGLIVDGIMGKQTLKSLKLI